MTKHATLIKRLNEPLVGRLYRLSSPVPVFGKSSLSTNYVVVAPVHLAVDNTHISAIVLQYTDGVAAYAADANGVLFPAQALALLLGAGRTDGAVLEAIGFPTVIVQSLDVTAEGTGKLTFEICDDGHHIKGFTYEPAGAQSPATPDADQAFAAAAGHADCIQRAQALLKEAGDILEELGNLNLNDSGWECSPPWQGHLFCVSAGLDSLGNYLDLILDQ